MLSELPDFPPSAARLRGTCLLPSEKERATHTFSAGVTMKYPHILEIKKRPTQSSTSDASLCAAAAHAHRIATRVERLRLQRRWWATRRALGSAREERSS